jgi:hypothetical protein
MAINMEFIDWNDVQKVDIRVGKRLSVIEKLFIVV